MKKTSQAPVSVHSISELHKLMGLRGPAHPMISLVDNTKVVINLDKMPDSFVLDFYKISYKKTMKGRIGYGQGYYDFDEGGLIFTAPHQVIHFDRDVEYYGFSILFHPDLLRNYPLGKNMTKYGFFSYDTREALHLSEKERNIILNIMEQIGAELETNIDDFSQDVIISYLEVLLNYSNRFYKRQFITRKALNHDLLTNMEELLAAYFEERQGLKIGLPTVEHLADQLNLSPRYLSDMLRSLTGQSAQQHIHQKLIDKAKEYLTTTNLSVSEIAYMLGFERPQSFNKLFRKKTELSPLEFKQTFN
ncbi:Helix-turn-helix domain-containing protein [Mucilaginibacter gossypiicola]|uniref:Helix-turn-helix domain-containing protein n=1 Tax=Mucilaginibacter gossypiicola TaxID=551995 RepID=A0A1H8UJQ3_9SPHI|nr:helix-turn-helix transcriptional regulator [Mucilaginibacter gossypiicola]SEP03452.1 Helix-turn-helix domain-containing protein [Mucilaginibacter gossypiicola]